MIVKENYRRGTDGAVGEQTEQRASRRSSGGADGAAYSCLIGFQHCSHNEWRGRSYDVSN